MFWHHAWHWGWFSCGSYVVPFENFGLLCHMSVITMARCHKSWLSVMRGLLTTRRPRSTQLKINKGLTWLCYGKFLGLYHPLMNIRKHEHKRIGSKKEEKWIVVIRKITILRKKWFLGENENHELVKIWKENQSYFSSNSILKWT